MRARRRKRHAPCSGTPGPGCRRSCVSETTAHTCQNHGNANAQCCLGGREEGRGARGGRRTGSAPPSPAAEETAASSSPSSRAPELAAGNSVWLAPLLRLRRQQRAKSAWRTEGVGWVGECERWAAHVGRAGAAVHHRRRRSGADRRVHADVHVAAARAAPAAGGGRCLPAAPCTGGGGGRFCRPRRRCALPGGGARAAPRELGS